MRQRALVHIAGPPGAGKTTLIERLLEAGVALAICVRAERDPRLKSERESAPRAHPELRRYRVGAACAGAALYRFPEADLDSFFVSVVMQDYSEAVYIEGDCPVEHVDLDVFVAPVLPPGQSLLQRVRRKDRPLQDFYDLVTPPALANLRGTLAAPLASLRRSLPSRPGKSWSLHEAYQGIESAQLVVVNVRDDHERERVADLVDAVARLRKDAAVFRDVLGPLGQKTPVTVVAANLAEPRDPGLKKAIARVKRAVRANSGP